ncbi:hypothetical protein SAMN04488122_3187 [Chitinophaga arvensicola]|uniref:DUF6850 domain-containing protein n=1 Tax=Chitinophaga arvensicola TaxID=29529 RepID=A0A1I0RPL4_9BACT|nr:hypothetical protein SAMN04488122_3187 [Chitinophaga arvensicola]
MSPAAVAQSTQPVQTPVAPEQVPLLRPWLQTQNAAGLQWSDVPAAGYTAFGTQQENGDFKKSQQPESDRQLLFHSSRYQPLKKGVLYGSFNYIQQWSGQVHWSDVLNPYRGTPYIMADSIGGDWKKQRYDLELKAATARLANNKLVLGAGVRYSVYTGARQNDPRPLNNAGELTLTPSLVYQLGKRQQIGLSGLYGFYKEDISFELKNTNVTHSLYKLLGLGQVSSPPSILAVSASRYYNGKKYGGALQYSISGQHWQWLTEASYASYTEKVTDGSGIPLLSGTWKKKDYQLRSVWQYTAADYAHRITAVYKMNDGSGIESHQKLVDGFWQTILEATFYTATQSTGRLEYLLMKQRTKDQYAWYAKAGITWSDTENKYLVPVSRQQYSSLRYDITAARNWSLGTYSGIEAQVQAAYRTNLNAYLNYSLMTNSSNIVAQQVLYPDHDYYTANAVEAGASVQYHFSWKEAAAARFFLRLNAVTTQRTAATALPYGPDGSRQRFAFTIGAFY